MVGKKIGQENAKSGRFSPSEGPSGEWGSKSGNSYHIGGYHMYAYIADTQNIAVFILKEGKIFLQY